MTDIHTLLEGITLVPGDGTEHGPVTVRLQADGTVAAIELGAGDRSDGATLVLAPAAVDLHLDVMPERRRPRAGVLLDLDQSIVTLDAELVANGIGTVCIAARFEEEPAKGVGMADAIATCEAVERLAASLACDWRIHARVEVTEPEAPAQLRTALDVTTRIVLISVMDHSLARSRFASEQAHREFYAEDWGVSLEEVDRVLERKRSEAKGSDARREEIAEIAHAHGIVLASHDDRTAEDVHAGAEIGATVAEFPLSEQAAEAAKSLGIASVLGAPNVVRGRSTSPGNILAADAVTRDLCTALCSDYLPSALLAAPFVLADDHGLGLADALALTSTSPAGLLGLSTPVIAEGRPLDGVLISREGGTVQAVALWRQGQLVFLRRPAEALPVVIG